VIGKVLAGAVAGYLLFLIAAIFLFGIESDFWIQAWACSAPWALP